MGEDTQASVSSPPAPPPGFQLDAPLQNNSAPPPPPDGFELDKPQEQPPPKQKAATPTHEPGWSPWDPLFGGLSAARAAVGKVGDWAQRKRDEAEVARLASHKEPTDYFGPGTGRVFNRAAGYDLLARMAHMGEGATSPTSLATMAGTAAFPVAGGAALAAKGVYEGAKHAPGALRGNPEEAEASLSGFSQAAGGGAAIGGGLSAARSRAQTAMPQGTRPTVRQTLAQTNEGRAAGAVSDTLSPITEKLRVPEAPKALTQAIQPGVNIPRAQESIKIAGPRLQQLKQAGLLRGTDGEPIADFKSPADLLEGIKGAKSHVWDEIERRSGPISDLQTDTSPIADAMEKSVSKRTESQFPQTAARIKERAATYRSSMSLRDVENAIQDANNDLRNFYRRPGATDSPTGPDMAATEAEVKAARSMLDEKVEGLRGAGVKDLKREYGALRDVEKATARANAVATRQKGATLWEGLAALRAAGDFASGNVLGAAKGAGTLAVGRWLANLRDPNFLIDKAFQGGKSFKPASAIPRPPIDVVQGEFVEPTPGVQRAGPPRAQVLGRTALPSADRLQLGAGAMARPPITTPDTTPPAPRALPPGRLPRKVVGLLSKQGANEVGPGTETIVPGARRALPPAPASAGVAARTPEHGIRTVGGLRLSPEGMIEGRVANVDELGAPKQKITEQPAEEGPRITGAERQLQDRLKQLEARISLNKSQNKSLELMKQRRELVAKIDQVRERQGGVAQQYSPETIQRAKEELVSALDMWGQLPEPGRSFYEGESPEERLPPRSQKESWTGTNSPRGSVEDMFPWVKEQGAHGLSDLKAALRQGKGAAFERWLQAAAEYVEKQGAREPGE